MQADKALIALSCTWSNTRIMSRQSIGKKLLNCLLRCHYECTLLPVMHRSCQFFLNLFTSLPIEVLALTSLCGIQRNTSSPQIFSLPVNGTFTVSALSHVTPLFPEKEKPLLKKAASLHQQNNQAFCSRLSSQRLRDPGEIRFARPKRTTGNRSVAINSYTFV